jgi:hypothetical protein
MGTALTFSPGHTVWDCRWSRPGHRITGVSDALQPESLWVCVRDDDRRDVSDEECARCSRWEPALVAAAPVAMHASPLALLVAHGIEQTATAAPMSAEALQLAGYRAVLVLTAIAIIALGLVVLTSPLAVFFTISLWMVAAVLVALAVLVPGTQKLTD